METSARRFSPLVMETSSNPRPAPSVHQRPECRRGPPSVSPLSRAAAPQRHPSAARPPGGPPDHQLSPNRRDVPGRRLLRPIAIRPARAPASANGNRTVVRAGTASMLNGRSSNPATDTS